jgi:hypothetical protein
MLEEGTIEEKPVVTTTPPITEMKPETQVAIVAMAEKAAEMIKTELAPVELIPPVTTPPAVTTPETTIMPVTTPATTAEPVTEIPSEMKIVITASKSSIMIGLQKADCDPQFYQVKDLLGAVKGIPVFLGMAMKV